MIREAPKILYKAFALLDDTLKRPNAFISLNGIVREVEIRLCAYFIAEDDIIGILKIVGDVVSLILVYDWIHVVDCEEKLIAIILEESCNVLLGCASGLIR